MLNVASDHSKSILSIVSGVACMLYCLHRLQAMLSKMLQADVLALESAGGSRQEAEPDELAALHKQRQSSYDRLLQLEQEVQLHRKLMEAEERTVYIDLINELLDLYSKIEAERQAQGHRLTNWVCV
jgi:DNA-binding FadR family transcriptional regulator